MRAKTRLDSTAVFRDRDRMEDAVRALVDEGVSPKRILVSRGTIVDGRVRTAPERSDVLVTGLGVGFVVGATFAVLWMVALGVPELVSVPLPWIVLRALGAAAGGAVIGALVAILVDALARGRRDELGDDARDFVVTVKTPDARAAEDVRTFLALRGGDLLPA